jgi:hypothetical protein
MRLSARSASLLSTVGLLARPRMNHVCVDTVHEPPFVKSVVNVVILVLLARLRGRDDRAKTARVVVVPDADALRFRLRGRGEGFFELVSRLEKLKAYGERRLVSVLVL